MGTIISIYDYCLIALIPTTPGYKCVGNQQGPDASTSRPEGTSKTKKPSGLVLPECLRFDEAGWRMSAWYG